MQYDEARERVGELVALYSTYAADYASSASEYNETQLRVDYLNPFLECLGWDVNNSAGQPTFVRDVRQEFSLTGDENRGTRPDYTIRTFGATRFFLEAKKPSVRIGAVDGPARQVRRYGWTENLSVSVLSNFAEFAVYDCTVPPREGDDRRTARLSYLTFEEYVDRFDELWRFSREVVASGEFDAYYDTPADVRLSEPFDQYFLRQLNEWRLLLGEAVLGVQPELAMDELNYVVQQLLNRILFLRIAEDRQLEVYERLLRVQDFAELVALFTAAEARYDSGLFDFVKDSFTPTLDLPARAIAEVMAGLYYPNSPFDFSVLDASTLGQVYEVFLGQRLSVVDGVLRIELAPEVEAGQARGVVATPPSLVRRIVQQGMQEVVDGRSVETLLDIKLLDMSCGSGPFVIAGYEFLLNESLDRVLELGEDAPVQAIEIGPQTWKLPFAYKRAVLESCVRAVDLDLCAVELTRFGLLLKLLEDVTAAELDDYMRTSGNRALPDLDSAVIWGNSIVGPDFSRLFRDRARDDARMASLRPMDWGQVFPQEIAGGGFDAILGNPPYVRIQNMRQYAADEMDYLQDAGSSIESTKRGNPDKFFAFLERAVGLLSPTGHAAFVVKNQFMYVASAETLRTVLTTQSQIRSIVDFGTQSVFPQGRQVYTCIVHLAAQGAGEVSVEEVRNVGAWVQGSPGSSYLIDAARLGSAPWLLAPPEVLAVFDKLYAGERTSLAQVAPPFVGVQTSADDVYMLKGGRLNGDASFEFTDKLGVEWAIETGLLREALYDQPLGAFSHAESNVYVIFPYEVGDTVTAIPPGVMADRYPRTLAYLDTHRAQLDRRSINGGSAEAWYRYGRSQSLAKFDGRQKVIWPTLSTGPRYALDVQNSVFTGGGNGPYYAFRSVQDHIDERFLMAVMSHPVVDSLVCKLASSFRGDYASHGKEFVENIPIPIVSPDDTSVHDRVVEDVQALIDMSDELTQNPTALRRQELEATFVRRRREIDDVISGLYDLAAEEVVTVTRYARQEGLPVEEA